VPRFLPRTHFLYISLKVGTPGGDSLTYVRPLVCAAAILVSGLAVGISAPSGAASHATPGDGCLVVTDANGRVSLNLTRGIVFGRFDSGTIVASDDGAQLPTVKSAVATLTGVKIGEHTWKYGPADNVRFRTSGPTKLTVREANFIELSAVGRGTATLSGASFFQPATSSFSVDSSSFCLDGQQDMPSIPTKYQISSPIAGSG